MSFDYLPWNVPVDAQGHVAVRDARVELTYAELDDWTRAVAGQLAGHGFGTGDVVAIMLPNRVELLVTLLAAWRLGGAATPVNPAFTNQEADYQINDSGAKLVVNLDAERRVVDARASPWTISSATAMAQSRSM